MPRVAFFKDATDYDEDGFEYYYDESERVVQVQDDNRWCIFSIQGNTTIVLRRKDDFVRYFKMNVASLTGSEYDDIRVNSITYTPHLIVNASIIHWSARSERIIKVLSALARHNDTLLDLSGVHFNVTHFATSEMLMAPKPVAPYMVGSGINLDNESEDLEASTTEGGHTNLRLLNTSIDSEKLEAVIFVIVGVAIAFLLTASLFFAACQCIYRNKTNTMPPSDSLHRKSQMSLLDDEELMRRARRSSTYSTSIRAQSRNNSISLNEFQTREDSIVSAGRKTSRMSSPISGLSSPSVRQQEPPNLIYSPDFSNSLNSQRMAADEEEICLIGKNELGLYKMAHSKSNSNVSTLKRKSSNRRSFPGETSSILINRPMSRSRESLSSSSYNYTTSENSFYTHSNGVQTLKTQRPDSRQRFYTHHHHRQPKRPSSVASAPISRNSTLVQYRHRRPDVRMSGEQRAAMMTFRNDLVPNKFEPLLNSDKFSGHFSDVADFAWTDTEDEVANASRRAAPPPDLFLSTFRRPAGHKPNDIHDQPLSQSMITSPVLIPPPSSPPGVTKILIEAEHQPIPPVSENAFTIPTPDEIKKDVDTIFKNMGLDERTSSDVIQRAPE